MDGTVERSHGETAAAEEEEENLIGGEEDDEGVAVEPSVGMEFPTDGAARAFYCAYAARAGFAVRTYKSRRDDSFVMRRFVCTREGFHKPDLPEEPAGSFGGGRKRKRKRVTVREGCMAMLEVSRKDSPVRWAVTSFVAHHVHPVALPVRTPPPLTGAATSPFNEAPTGAFKGAPTGAFDIAPNAASDEEPTEAPAAAHGASTGTLEEPIGEFTATFDGPPIAAFDEPTGSPNGGALFCSRVVRANPSGERHEVQGVLEYLRKMQAESPGFFYAMQVDSSNCVSALFWADAKARMAYKSFRDAVTFDTTYKKTKYMMPFAVFRGVNHHLQGITFGCCLLMDETKGSYTWLFDTWLAAMGGRHPGLLVTDQGKNMEAAIARVLPNTRHRFCQRHILSRCKQKLSDVYMKHISLKADLKECVGSAETIEEFQTRWNYILDKYSLQENPWLQSLYNSRHQWAWVYQKGFFFPELLKSQRSESLNKFFKTHFNTKTPLLVFISRFDQVMAFRFEKEAQADFETVYSKPALKTPSVIERQAASIYTKAVFDVFQEEFIESLGYHADKIEDGMNLKYNVARDEEIGRSYIVTFNKSDKKAECTCRKFEYAGILCRHVLRIFFMVGVRSLLEEYIVKRWTMDAVGSVVLDERPLESGVGSAKCLAALYNDLCLDSLTYGMRAAMSPDVYKVAKTALQKAFADVVAAKNQQMIEQQNCSRQQDMLQQNMPLLKLQPKRTPTKK